MGGGGPGGGPGFPLQIGQSKAKFQMEPNTGVTFDDVAGVDEAKQDFMEVVEFLKKPERFTAVGARIPKGVLLVGPPGTGKTLLAKAIAGEAGVPFFSISGSEFVEMFVGVGASRVRDLFKKAKENAPCIVFVDEIDAVGRQRGTGIGGGNDEREQTLNQLLTEMDGFEGNTGVIVVSVDVPDVKGRTDILKVHSGNKKFENGVSLEVIAMRTPGFSGADLANLLNEAAILAGRRGKTAISSKEIDDSIDRIVAGMEGTVMTDGKSKSLVAYHEVGHAVCGTLTPGHDAVQKVTLIPRGQARGLTWFIPSDDPTLISKQQLFARIVGGLGGRAAEEVIFGEPEVTTGAVGDLQQITGLAKQMVTTFGMSEIGPWSLMDSSAQSDVIMRMMARNSMSEKLANDIDSAVKTLSDRAYEIALGHIRNNREAMDKIVEVLLEKETMSGDEFRAILSEFTEIPPENRVASSSTIQRVRVQLPGLSQELLQKLRAKNIDFAAHNAQEDQGSPLLNLIGNLAFPVILIGGLFLLSRRSSGGGMGGGGPGGGPGFPLQIGQSKAKFQMEPNTGVTFDDVAGVDEAKQDFMEVVEFLKKPERFTAVGARIPKGVLLVGPPGTGKTLLAKAIAGEAGVPFFSISGSEFVEMFVGVGASRVRDLFKKAKENAPCIVFVDEIDAVGRQRGTGIGGGNDEREQTLNQLLTEMDGFEGNTGVIVVAATNRADILDSALLRPGRFDRQVSVDVPDVKGRTDILKVHSGNKKFENGVSLEVIAMRTPGFSGADLANLLNEAAILAGRRGKTAISSKEIDDSIDRIVAGMEGTVMTDGKSKSLVAYHEVGHAVCGTLTPGHDAVQKVTLIPRGQARGLTWFIPSDDPTLISKQQLFARIVGGLGGRAAEEVVFGEPEVTTGAVGDLQQITGLAKQMVTTFGMSEIGPWSLMDSSAQSDVIMRMMARNSMSEKLANDIDSAVKTLSDRAYEIALGHIRNNREAMDKIVEVLLEKETMSGDEFRAILSEFTEIPPENRVASSSTSTSTPTPAPV
ncbi:hypothetical protein F2Q69_00058280 [Brassica cretica]|uniref:AAA+ ATPase domain-containing protein n=1 Tax=Brassica cretica TaxID=69181 RepID=A0A8S9RPV5_BRACR|nr:hypothetical protein F2Q69_00058280 [Brassica cretica]